jgi:hypothetical protein
MFSSNPVENFLWPTKGRDKGVEAGQYVGTFGELSTARRKHLI